MKFFKVAIMATAITGFAASAQAQDSGTYINVGVKTYEFDTYNLMGRIGYNFNENFGVEGEGSIGISGTDETDDEFGVKTKYDLGAYLIGRLPVTENFDLFARVGYSTVNVEVEGFGETEDANIDGFAVGAGVQYNFDSMNGVRLGYTYNDGDDLSADVWDVSYVRKF